jgi:hypothetical protein
MKNMCGIDAYRAALGRMNSLRVVYPARWAGLGNYGPLARTFGADGASSRSFATLQRRAFRGEL